MFKKTKTLIFAANLHVGGGVQVAASLISEIGKNMKSEKSDLEIHVLTSTEVHDNIDHSSGLLQGFASYNVKNVYGLFSLFDLFSVDFSEYDLTYVVFGPFYSLLKPKLLVSGFANAYLLPNRPCIPTDGVLSRVLLEIEIWLKRLAFKMPDKLVVEADWVKEQLVICGVNSRENIYVVHNCLSRCFVDIDVKATSGFIERSGDYYLLGYVGRNYPHKNILIFKEVSAAIFVRFGISVKLAVTFSDDEWDKCDPEFKNCAINVGKLKVEKCPSFYRSIDGLFFPSLLECFSITPVEAMAMMIPLFVSDRPFNREVCCQYANYFNPLDPVSMADLIGSYLKNLGCKTWAAQEAREYAIKRFSPNYRFEKTIEYIVELKK
jgi:glycosyltransferase involved in cell wall biosynthesis